MVKSKLKLPRPAKAPTPEETRHKLIAACLAITAKRRSELLSRFNTAFFKYGPGLRLEECDEIERRIASLILHG